MHRNNMTKELSILRGEWARHFPICNTGISRTSIWFCVKQLEIFRDMFGFIKLVRKSDYFCLWRETHFLGSLPHTFRSRRGGGDDDASWRRGILNLHHPFGGMAWRRRCTGYPESLEVLCFFWERWCVWVRRDCLPVWYVPRLGVGIGYLVIFDANSSSLKRWRGWCIRSPTLQSVATWITKSKSNHWVWQLKAQRILIQVLGHLMLFEQVSTGVGMVGSDSSRIKWEKTMLYLRNGHNVVLVLCMLNLLSWILLME